MVVLAEGSMTHGTFDRMSIHEIKSMLDTNVYQTGFFTKMLIKKFYQRAYAGKKSSIITVSSTLSRKYTPGTIIYSASKAFVTYFTMALGYELLSKTGEFSFEENMIDV